MCHRTTSYNIYILDKSGWGEPVKDPPIVKLKIFFFFFSGHPLAVKTQSIQPTDFHISSNIVHSFQLFQSLNHIYYVFYHDKTSCFNFQWTVIVRNENGYG